MADNHNNNRQQTDGGDDNTWNGKFPFQVKTSKKDHAFRSCMFQKKTRIIDV